MQTLSQFLRDRLPPNDIEPAELNRRAREVWDAISEETDDKTRNTERVSRLYAMCRDIQQARRSGARDVTVHRIVALLMLTLARAYWIGSVTRGHGG